MLSNMDDKAKTLLGKLLALATSPHHGEASNALRRAGELLGRHGMSFADLQAGGRPAAAKATPPQAPAPAAAASRAHPFEGFEEFMERREPGFQERERAERMRRREAEETYRASVLEKYGSRAAALADTVIEAAINAVFGDRDAARADHYVQGIREEPPVDLMNLARKAWPFPETLAAGKREHDAWSERARERATVERIPRDCALSPGCAFRMRMMDDLLMSGLAARTVADALARMDYMADSGMTWDNQEIDLARGDLTALMAAENAGNHELSRTATRRRHIEGMLTDPDTAGLSDREIARRAGASPQTVGNIRRRLAPRS